jgi:hypothetical protein
VQLTKRFTLLSYPRDRVGEEVTVISDDSERKWYSNDGKEDAKQTTFKRGWDDVSVA